MNDYSAIVATLVFTKYPAWRRYSSEHPDTDGTSYLLIEVPAPPAAQVDRGLTLTTSDYEITVCFDAWHEHCPGGWDLDRPSSEMQATCGVAWLAAQQLVDDLMAERIMVASWWFEDQWRGTQCVPAGTPLHPPDLACFNRQRVRSWNGSLNADSRVDPFTNGARMPCPKCGSTDGSACGQLLNGTRLHWYRVTRCSACHAALLEDGGHYAPAEVRATLLAAEGTWRPTLEDPVDDVTLVADAVRRALLVGARGALAFVRGAADDPTLGTRTEAEWAAARLATFGLRATPRRIDLAPVGLTSPSGGARA